MSAGWTTAMHEAAAAGQALRPLAQADAPRLTVAIPFHHSGAWAAQTSFLRSVALSMRRCMHPGSKLLLLNFSGAEGERALAPDLRDLLLPAEPDIWKSQSRRTEWLQSLGIHCVLNLFGPPPEGLDPMGLVCWIADFQHTRLPQFFPAQELKDRDEVFARILRLSHRVLLSSQDAARDCARFDPAATGKARVCSFPSGFAFQELTPADPGTVCRKYHLPAKFALVANQFWAHKNHLSVIESARLLMERGNPVPIVLTGLPADYRDPANQLVSRVLQAISIAGLREHVIPLAQVPYPDLIALLRHAALVIQPSSFEGWSTTVQDAKALGRPVACSSISLHKEQAPSAIGFFDPAKPAELADLLDTHWSSLTPGPDPVAESQALAAEQTFASGYGTALWQTCAEAAAAAHPYSTTPC
jgi:glycosyltransferase involved in cell wall biosynthesis